MYLTEDDLIVKTVLPGMKTDEIQIKIIGYELSTKDEANKNAKPRNSRE